GAALARDELRDLEVRVVLEERCEALPDHARCAEDADLHSLSHDITTQGKGKGNGMVRGRRGRPSPALFRFLFPRHSPLNRNSPWMARTQASLSLRFTTKLSAISLAPTEIISMFTPARPTLVKILPAVPCVEPMPRPTTQ